MRTQIRRDVLSHAVFWSDETIKKIIRQNIYDLNAQSDERIKKLGFDPKNPSDREKFVESLSYEIDLLLFICKKRGIKYYEIEKPGGATQENQDETK